MWSGVVSSLLTRVEDLFLQFNIIRKIFCQWLKINFAYEIVPSSYSGNPWIVRCKFFHLDCRLSSPLDIWIFYQFYFIGVYCIMINAKGVTNHNFHFFENFRIKNLLFLILFFPAEASRLPIFSIFIMTFKNIYLYLNKWY